MNSLFKFEWHGLTQIPSMRKVLRYHASLFQDHMDDFWYGGSP